MAGSRLTTARSGLAGALKPELQIRARWRAPSFELHPLVFVLGEVCIYLGLMVEVGRDGAIHMRRGQAFEILADALGRRSLTEGMYDGIERDPRPRNAILDMFTHRRYLQFDYRGCPRYAALV